MTEPAAYDPKLTPAIQIGGKMWPIPELAARQLEHAWEPMVAVTDALSSGTIEEFGQKVVRMTRAQYSAMLDVVYLGLTRAHPQMTRDEFLDLPTTTNEIVAAFLVVRAQSGMFVAPGGGEKPQGGASGEAAAAPDGQIGIR